MKKDIDLGEVGLIREIHDLDIKYIKIMFIMHPR
jgi:hypothetical protein